MKLEVGMYIRTKDGLIRKVIGIDKLIYVDESYLSDEPEYHDCLIPENIKEMSYNILDILYRYDIIDTEYGIGHIHHKINDNEFMFDDGLDLFEVHINDIHSILTREQFNKYSYNFKSEEEI